jgi:hypothetical protein
MRKHFCRHLHSSLISIGVNVYIGKVLFGLTSFGQKFKRRFLNLRIKSVLGKSWFRVGRFYEVGVRIDRFSKDLLKTNLKSFLDYSL